MLLLWACAEVAPTNPYDPETPIAQQARGRLSGQLRLPESFDGAMRFDGMAATLVPVTGDMAEPLRAAIDAEGRCIRGSGC